MAGLAIVRSRRLWLAWVLLCVWFVAIVVVLNLHIFTGVVEGYMASPAQVVEHSLLLAVVDVVLLVAAPVVAFVVVVRFRSHRFRRG